jgi:hypothetical protein
VDRQEEADHKMVVGWNVAAMTKEDAEAVEKPQVEVAKERSPLDAECTEDEVELGAAWCTEAMSSVLNAMAKKIRICVKLKRWWNADINERRTAVRRETGRRWNSDKGARVKAELQKSIQRSKRHMWSDYLQSLR